MPAAKGTKNRLGVVACWSPGCGQQVVVKMNELTGVAGYTCQHCGFSPYFRKGEPCTEILLSSIQSTYAKPINEKPDEPKKIGLLANL